MKIFSSLLFAVLIFHSIYSQEFNFRINDDSIVVKPNFLRNDNTFLQSYNPNDKEKYFPLNSFNTGTGIWTELNPNVPRVDYIGVDFINLDTGWAVGLWGAALKTTNGGQSWTTLETPTGEILLKVHSYNGQVVMAVGHNGTILRSSDGGESFTLLTGITTQELWGVKMLNDTLGWICGRNQTLLKTTDAGLTWQNISTGYNYHYWSFDFLDNNNFMIACSFGKILKTTNGGINWTIYQAGNTEDLFTIDIIDSLHIAAAGSFGKNVYSTDGGINWIENTTLTASPLNWIQFVNYDTGYTIVESAGLYKTTNRGLNWFDPGFNDAGDWQFELLGDSLGYGVGAGLTVSKTEDGFITGRNLFLNKNWSDVFFINESKGFISSIDLGVKLYKTEDEGNTFQIIESSPSRIYDILFMDSLIGFLGSNTIYKSIDGGEIWYQTTGAGQTSKITFVNSLNGWAVGGRNIYRTTDGGETWVLKFTHTSLSFNSVSFADSLNGWVSGGRPQKTTDGGDTWLEQSNTDIWFADDVYFSSIDTVWIAKYTTINNSLFKTTDGGTSWLETPDVIGARKFRFFPDPNHWLIIGFERYYMTYDNGNSWYEFTNDVPTGLTSFSAPADNLGYAVGSLGLILKYNDTTYVPVELISFYAKTTNNIVDLSWETASEINNYGFEIQRSLDKINWETIGFVKGNGTKTVKNYYTFKDQLNNIGFVAYRLKQIDYNGTFSFSDTVKINLAQPTIFQLFQNFPNPFNPTTTISFSIPIQSNVKIEFYDVTGQKILNLLNDELEPGSHSILLNVNNLSSGVYIYRMVTNQGYTDVKKLTVIK